MKNIFEHEKENYHEPVRVSNFWSSNHNNESNHDI